MSKKILIVDDEVPIQQMLSDLFTDAGYEVVVASDGEEAIRLFNVDPPDFAIIDFLLRKKNGFDVARAVRQNPLVAECPLIIMSGVFKNPKTAVEAREDYGAIAFLDKPFDLEHIKSLVRGALDGDAALKSVDSATFELQLSGEYESEESNEFSMPAPENLSDMGEIERPFSAIKNKGVIDDFPVALLLSIIRYDRLTGILDLNGDGIHRRVYVIDGSPVFMQSNAEGENVGVLLYNRGRINQPDYERCVTYMDSKSITMQRALLELRLATEKELATAYKLLAQQLLPASLGMASGEYRWRETDAFIGRVPEGKFEPANILFSGVRDYVSPTQIIRFFQGREDVPLVKSSEYAALLPFFRRVFSGNRIGSKVDGKTTYRTLVRNAGESAPVVNLQLFALATSGMILFPEVSEDNFMDVVVNEAASEVAALRDGGLQQEPATDDISLSEVENQIDYTDQENAARSKILAMADKVMNQSFFQILGLGDNQEVTAEDLRDKYYALTKKWHSDAFSGLRLGPEEEVQKEIFHRISEAYDTLSDRSKRQEYAVYLDRKKKGLPTDVETVMEAEKTFDEALEALKRKNLDTAKGLLDRAIAMNKGEAIYQVYAGWVLFLVNGKSKEASRQAIPVIKQAIELQEKLPKAYEFLGRIHEILGETKTAKSMYKRCLEHEPNNIEVARAIRLINTRAEKAKKSGGLISKFLSKK